MATFRSFLSRWILVAAVFCGSFISLGAAFVPFGTPIPGACGPVLLSPSREVRIPLGPMEVKPFFRHCAVLSRLEALVLTERTVARSA